MCNRRKLEAHKIEKIEKDRLAVTPIAVKRRADIALSSGTKLPVVKRRGLITSTPAVEKPLPTTTLPQPTTSVSVTGKFSLF